MPIITIESTPMNKEKKARLVEEMVNQASRILEIPVEAFVTVIRENDADNIGNGVQLLSEKLKK